MKIAIVNYRYFASGGPEKYMFNIKSLLESKGHTVIPFSIENSKNERSEYSYLWLNSIENSVYYAETPKNLTAIFKYLSRMFYSFEVKKCFGKFLDKTKPDIVYVLHFHNKMSPPSIVSAARKRKIPIIQRISDFQYICPNAAFRNDRIGICECCLHGKYVNCIKYRCVHNSRILSALKLFAKLLHDYLGVVKNIDAFVVPSKFTIEKLKQYGISKEKLNHIPTFFCSPSLSSAQSSAIARQFQPFFLFIGRLSKEKGLLTLIRAFVETEYNLKIIGAPSGDSTEKELREYLSDKKHSIEFLGYKKFDEIIPYLENCLCTIIPSEWYENSPNTALESFAFKKAVIASNIGSMPENVIYNETGILFETGSADDLRKSVKFIAQNPDVAKRMGENGYEKLKDDYSAEGHYRKLMEVFEKSTKEMKR